MLNPIAAVSVGVVGGEVMLDLPYEEDSQADVDMNVVAVHGGGFIEVQGTGERTPFSADQLADMTTLAQGGCNELFELQRAAIAAALG